MLLWPAPPAVLIPPHWSIVFQIGYCRLQRLGRNYEKLARG
jgi:hypothetical protein